MRRTSFPNSDPKPRPRLHKSTIVVALLTLAVMIVIVVPGVVAQPESKYGTTSTSGVMSEYVHGWPATFLRRPTDDRISQVAIVPSSSAILPSLVPQIDRGELLPWFYVDAWDIAAGNRRSDRIRWSPLALDLIVMTLIVAAFAALWEWRRRRRRRALQFKLSTILALLTLSAAAFGWLRYQQVEYRREQTHLTALNSLATPDVYVERNCIAPSWLTRLVSARALPVFLQRVHTATIVDSRGRLQPTSFEARLEPLTKLKRLTAINFGRLPTESSHTFALLAEAPSLRSLQFTSLGFANPIDGACVEQLAKLKQLERLAVWERTDLTDEAWAIVREKMPQCEVVCLSE